MTIDYPYDNSFFFLFKRDSIRPLREMARQCSYGDGVMGFLAPCFEI